MTRGWSTDEVRILREAYNSGENLRAIAARLHKSYFAVWRYAKLYLGVIQPVNSSPSPQPRETRLPATEDPRQPALLITCNREESKIVFFIKTNISWENYMASTRSLKYSTRLWGQTSANRIAFYETPLFNSSKDDINRDIIYNNEINLGVLRLKGISVEGVRVESSAVLISDEQLHQAVASFVKTFKTFFNSTVNKNQITGLVFENKPQVTEQIISKLVNVDEAPVQAEQPVVNSSEEKDSSGESEDD